MNRDDFLALEENEQLTFLTNEEEQRKLIEDLTAERDSFRDDNSKLTEENKKLSDEIRQVKTTNYALARQVKTSSGNIRQEPEEIIHNMFVKGEKNDHRSDLQFS